MRKMIDYREGFSSNADALETFEEVLELDELSNQDFGYNPKVSPKEDCPIVLIEGELSIKKFEEIRFFLEDYFIFGFQNEFGNLVIL